MNRINQENLKSYILVILIITSLIQIGILWNYQYQGIPINVISSFFVNNFVKKPVPPPVDADEYLKPFRIIASEGFDESHWAIYKNNSTYDILWNDLKTNYLEKILSSNPVQSYAIDEWANFITAKSFTFEYKTNINYEIFTGFLNVKEIASNRPTGIYKILISPWENVNYNLTAYIMDDTKIYKYVIPISSKGLSRDADSKSFESEMDKLKGDTTLRDYKIFKELIPGTPPFPVSPDILCVAKGLKDSKFSSLKNMSISLPTWISSNWKNGYDELAQYVLRDERDNYDVSDDNSGSKVLRNSNNIYKLSSNGILEYKYLSSPEGADKGNVYEAFKRAKEFLGQRRDLVSGQDQSIYLSGVSINKDNKELMDFTFDYIVSDMPLNFNYNSKASNGNVIKNAISITSDAKRVISCRWVLRNASFGKDVSLYNVKIGDLLTEIWKQIKTENRNLSIKDIGIGYEVESEMLDNLIPKWIITSQDGERIPMQLHKK